jgi:hypothetical protein
MGSSGTKINSQPAKDPKILVEGDQIQVGDTIFTFTRQPLPPGVRPVQFEDHDDDAFSRRSTQLAQRAVTMEGGKYPVDGSRRLPLMPMLIGAAIASILLVLYLVFR